MTYFLSQLPQMNIFPDVLSVLVLDNCRIHHMNTLQEILNNAGKAVLQHSLTRS